jgi:hypothetical protein
LTAQQYSFQLDNDVQKIITLRATATTLEVRVVFASDIIIDEINDSIPLTGAFEALADAHGLTIFYADRPGGRRGRRSRRY